MEIIKWFVLGVLVLIAIGLLVTNIRIVPQARAYVVERLGAYHGTWQVGLHIKIPLIDKVARKVSLKEKVIDFPPQPVITKDNVTMRIDTIVFFQITDPKLYAYGVETPIMAIETLTATTLRNIIKHHHLQQCTRLAVKVMALVLDITGTQVVGSKLQRLNGKTLG